MPAFKSPAFKTLKNKILIKIAVEIRVWYGIKFLSGHFWFYVFKKEELFYIRKRKKSS